MNPFSKTIVGIEDIELIEDLLKDFSIKEDSAYDDYENLEKELAILDKKQLQIDDYSELVNSGLELITDDTSFDDSTEENIRNSDIENTNKNNELLNLIPTKIIGTITILLDYSNCYDLYSYVEIKNEIKNKNPLLYTTCLNFFSFETLNLFYDVRIQKEIGGSILLTDLIRNTSKYTNESIDKSTDILNLVLTDKIKFI